MSQTIIDATLLPAGKDPRWIPDWEAVVSAIIASCKTLLCEFIR